MWISVLTIKTTQQQGETFHTWMLILATDNMVTRVVLKEQPFSEKKHPIITLEIRVPDSGEGTIPRIFPRFQGEETVEMLLKNQKKWKLNQELNG